MMVYGPYGTIPGSPEITSSSTGRNSYYQSTIYNIRLPVVLRYREVQVPHARHDTVLHSFFLIFKNDRLSDIPITKY